MNHDFVTPLELSKELRCNKRTVLNWIADGTIKPEFVFMIGSHYRLNRQAALDAICLSNIA